MQAATPLLQWDAASFHMKGRIACLPADEPDANFMEVSATLSRSETAPCSHSQQQHHEQDWRLQSVVLLVSGVCQSGTFSRFHGRGFA